MNLLITEQPLQVLPRLAAEIGLNNALVLQQIHACVLEQNIIIDDFQWVNDYSFNLWKSRFPFWSKRTIKRVFMDLENSKLLISQYFDSHKYYRVDHTALSSLFNNSIWRVEL